MYLRLFFFLSTLVVPVAAQLTVSQRTADFGSLADLYARRYAPLAWKQSVIHFDPVKVGPWLSRVAATQDDLSFYELMAEYVADLQDAHDQYSLPFDFEAMLGFTVDLYDGAVRVDSIDRTKLNAVIYPFQVGDELTSVDGKSAGDLIAEFSRYTSGGNPRTLQRFASSFITDRIQTVYPRAAQIGDTAAVVIKRQSGASETYQIPWMKSGTPLAQLGAGPEPTGLPPTRLARGGRAPKRSLAITAPQSKSEPFYQQFLSQYRSYALPGEVNVLGFDETPPVFALPANFVRRLGARIFDPFYTGSWTASDGTRIGYLRIPDFSYSFPTQLDAEISFFQSNTDVLVVDIMRNPGGDACSAEEILSRLTPIGFQGIAAEIHPDWVDILSASSALSDAQAQHAAADSIAQLQLYVAAFQKAFLPNASNTAALPLCGSTLTRNPAAAFYSKPVLLLVDEMSASSADIFAALAQDNHIATLYGYRTMGAGGSPEDDSIGVYTEGSTSVTRSMAVRPAPVVTSDYPTTQYLENVGVWPDITADFMTVDNLLNQGASFVSDFTAAAVKLAHGAQ